MYVVLPLDGGATASRWSGGRPLRPGFRYESDSNPVQLSPENLTELLGPLG
jgi:hypothetical protein